MTNSVLERFRRYRKCRHPRDQRTFTGQYAHPKGGRFGIVTTFRCDLCLKTIKHTELFRGGK